MIIGLTGTIASGKSLIASYLKEKGFQYYSFSDIIKEEAKKRKIVLTRENLQKLGNLLREENQDEGVLAKLILKKVKTQKAVLDGIRNCSEIKELRKRKDFVLIGVDAPQKLRYKRLRARARKGDPKTFNEFKEIDDKENRGYGQEVNKCLKKVDFLIINDSTISQLKKKVDSILASLK